MDAPMYKGMGQPVLSQGTSWLGRLGNLVGQGGVSGYLGAGQPALGGTGFFASSAPVYLQASSAIQPECTAENMMPDAVAMPCPVDCDPFSQGPIAIIVPRQG